MKQMLQVQGLCKQYEEFSLKNVSFDVPEGYIMGFIGPNGAGKTSTIKAILNMMHYDAGEITLFGQDAKHTPLNGAVGVVMDSPFYVEDWNVATVEQAVAPFYPSWNKETFAQYLERFQLSRKKKVKELSRGMKVKLMLSVALSHDAKLLILDEPTSGLDPVARDELCDLLGEYVTQENKSVLFSTHITSDLEKIADYLTFILNGEIIFSGEKELLLERYAIVKGGLEELRATRTKLIGLRTHVTGFDAMVETAQLAELPRACLIEPITLDEIVVYMSKEGRSV